MRTKNLFMPVVFAMAAMAFGSASALDPVQNDFWDTTGYVNAVPVEQEGAMSGTFDDGLSAIPAALLGFDSWFYTTEVSRGMDVFDSSVPTGLLAS